VQVSGSSEDKVLIMGATNRPQELDDAVLRWGGNSFHHKTVGYKLYLLELQKIGVKEIKDLF